MHSKRMALVVLGLVLSACGGAESASTTLPPPPSSTTTLASTTTRPPTTTTTLAPTTTVSPCTAYAAALLPIIRDVIAVNGEASEVFGGLGGGTISYAQGATDLLLLASRIGELIDEIVALSPAPAELRKVERLTLQSLTTMEDAWLMMSRELRTSNPSASVIERGLALQFEATDLLVAANEDFPTPGSC